VINKIQNLLSGRGEIPDDPEHNIPELANLRKIAFRMHPIYGVKDSIEILQDWWSVYFTDQFTSAKMPRSQYGSDKFATANGKRCRRLGWCDWAQASIQLIVIAVIIKWNIS
jgi:hypothetical protein